MPPASRSVVRLRAARRPGQAPARQAALGAGLDKHTTCTTLNKMCGSGMQAAILAHDLLLAGSAEVVVAGGMESMSNAPYLLDKARSGYRMGHGKIIDHMFLDGLEDAYDKGRLMGTFAEDCARPTASAAKPRTLRHRLADPRPAGDQGRPLRRRDRAGEVTEGKEKRVIRTTSSRPRRAWTRSRSSSRRSAKAAP
jgi:acetyl-CoA C-acetyltransferase